MIRSFATRRQWAAWLRVRLFEARRVAKPGAYMFCWALPRTAHWTGTAICVAEIVNRLKGYTSRVLRQEFPTLRSRLPTLWSRSYYAGTVGHVSAETVARYIAEQKGK